MIENYKLLTKHKSEIQKTIHNLKGKEWSLDFPVFIFNRCWFRLLKIKLSELPGFICTDNSQEAPELIHYKDLLKEGHDPLLAAQECWHEYGMEDFHRALRITSEWEKRGNNSWTFDKYTSLINQYRKYINESKITIPMIVLGRNAKDPHKLEWIYGEQIN